MLATTTTGTHTAPQEGLQEPIHALVPLSAAHKLEKSVVKGLPWRGEAIFSDGPEKEREFCLAVREEVLKHPHGSCKFSNIEISGRAFSTLGISELLELLLECNATTERLKAFRCGLGDETALLIGCWLAKLPAEALPQEIHLSHNEITTGAFDALMSVIDVQLAKVPRRLPMWLRLESNRIDPARVHALAGSGRVCLALGAGRCNVWKCANMVQHGGRPLLHMKFGDQQRPRHDQIAWCPPVPPAALPGPCSSSASLAGVAVGEAAGVECAASAQPNAHTAPATGQEAVNPRRPVASPQAAGADRHAAAHAAKPENFTVDPPLPVSQACAPPGTSSSGGAGRPRALTRAAEAAAAAAAQVAERVAAAQAAQLKEACAPPETSSSGGGGWPRGLTRAAEAAAAAAAQVAEGVAAAQAAQLKEVPPPPPPPPLRLGELPEVPPPPPSPPRPAAAAAAAEACPREQATAAGSHADELKSNSLSETAPQAATGRGLPPGATAKAAPSKPDVPHKTATDPSLSKENNSLSANEAVVKTRAQHTTKARCAAAQETIRKTDLEAAPLPTPFLRDPSRRPSPSRSASSSRPASSRRKKAVHRSYSAPRRLSRSARKRQSRSRSARRRRSRSARSRSARRRSRKRSRSPRPRSPPPRRRGTARLRSASRRSPRRKVQRSRSRGWTGRSADERRSAVRSQSSSVARAKAKQAKLDAREQRKKELEAQQKEAEERKRAKLAEEHFLRLQVQELFACIA